MSCSPNSSSPSSLSSNAGPQFATSPICAAEALAAVNLLPLPKVPTTGSRCGGIMSATNNITTLSRRQTVRPRSVDHHSWHEVHVGNSSSKMNHSLSNGTASTNSNSAPIIIVEQLNPLNRETFGGQGTTGNKDMASETRTSTNKNFSNASQSSLAGTGAFKSIPGSSVRMKTRPKMRNIPSSSSSPPPQENSNHRPEAGSSTGKKPKGGIWHQGRFDVRGSNSDTPFSWDTYLTHFPATVAPPEAFRQPKEHPKNLFEMHMKLEARDPRNFSNWSLASVIHVEGLQIGLRLEGTDKMNDLFELIDSENIRPIGSCPGEPLLAPTNYSKDIKTYPRFVEKILEKATYATPECFPPEPPRPPRNLFEPGMKLEAVDRKHRDLVCPATVTEVKGDKVRVSFDGWSDSFDYWCEYYSRDLFPVNYCRDVGRTIQQPGGWPDILKVQQMALATQGDRGSASPDRTFSGNDSPINMRRLTGRPAASTTKAHRASSPGTLLTKKRRGRPKRDARTDLDSPIRQPVNQSPETNNITQKIMDNDEHSPTGSIPKTLDMANNHHDDDEDELVAELPIEGYQCQRASVYPWQLIRLEKEKEKKEQDTSQMAQASTPVTSEQNLSVNDISTLTSDANTAPQDHEVKRPKLDQPQAWTIDDVIDLITKYETFTQYSELFRENEIDGKAFLLLTNEVLIKHMGVKVGHAVKMIDLVNQVKKKHNLA